MIKHLFILVHVLYWVFDETTVSFSYVNVTSAAVDLLLFLTVIIVLVKISPVLNFWNGSKLTVKIKTSPTFFVKASSKWKPYFKKDGYYGVFTETTLWA